LRTIRIWNYNDHARGNLNYGVKALEILVSEDGQAFRSAGVFDLRIAPENEERNYGQDIAVPVPRVRYARFDIKSNHDLGASYLNGSSPFVGLSKVSFFGREEIAGVRVKAVSSGTAFDPAADAELGTLHPRAEVRSDRDNSTYLKVWTPGTCVLRDSQGRSRTVAVAAVPQPVEIAGPWQVSFPKGWGAPEHTTFEKLTSWTESDDAGIKYFSGRAVYRKTFEVPRDRLDADTSVELDLGAVQHVARVTLNGRELGILWKPPYSIDVTGAVRAGTNTLVVEVANTWTNRLTGDAFLPPEQRYARSNLRASVSRTETPLQPSGLLGPVRIILAKHVKL